MSAMEKVYWSELLISGSTMVLVAAMYPWLGDVAMAAFALLALIAVFGIWFLRRGGSDVVIDERDRAIDQQAIRWGISAGWMALLLPLIAIVVWASVFDQPAVSIRPLSWLIWVQCAVCEGVKGFVGVRNYRRQRRAA